jgi:hypothetical protein
MVLLSDHAVNARGTPPFTPASPAPDHARRDRVTGRLRDLLGEDRTWTSAQSAGALCPAGVDLGGRQVRRYLALPKAGYRRTASTLEHKQNPTKVERATAVLDGLKKKRQPAGRSPTSSTSAGSRRPYPLGTRGACRASASGCGTSTRRTAG